MSDSGKKAVVTAILAASLAACQAAQVDTPVPTIFPTVEPTSTLAPATPTAKPSAEPSPSATPTDSPAPVDPILAKWDELWNGDRWADAEGHPLNFVAEASSGNKAVDQLYSGVILGATKLGDNDVILFVGMEDSLRNRYYASFKMFVAVAIEPTSDNSAESVFDGGGDVELVLANEFFDRIQAGQYVGDPVYISVPMKRIGTNGGPLDEAVRYSLPMARSLRSFALAAKDGNLTGLSIPDFVNNPDAVDGPLVIQIAPLGAPRN